MVDRKQLADMDLLALVSLRDAVSERIKEMKGEEKAVKSEKTIQEKAKSAKEAVAAIEAGLLKKGSSFVAKFKGEERLFVVDAITEKTVKVITSDGPRYIKFEAIVRLA